MSRAERAKFVATFYRERLAFWFGAYGRRDPLCRLHLQPGWRNPYPIYEELRARGPLSRSSVGPWVTVSHSLCHTVLRDRRFGAAAEEAPPTAPQLSFLEMNPPDHTRLRRFAAPTFSPKAVARFEPVIQRIVDRQLDRVRPGDRFDLVATLAAPMPIAVITELLGVPDANAAEFARYGSTFGSALGGLQSLAHAKELLRAQRRLAELFTRLWEFKRQHPGDDVISRAVADDHEQIRPEEFVPLCTLLLIAGFETTVNLIGNTVLALLQHPEAWRRVVADPALTEAAVEETLRWDPPVQRTARIASEDLTLAGEPVRQGDLVVTLLGGANRDPGVFERPAEFDLDRDARDHLAFSGGIHYCLGAPLARLEATIAVRTLLDRFPELSLAGVCERRPGSLIRGLQRFDVQSGPSRVPELTQAA